MENHNTKIACVLLATDIAKNKQFVLSTKSDEIELPLLEVSDEYFDNPVMYIAQKLKEYIFISDLELISQLISIKNRLPQISEEENTLYIIHGLLTPKSQNLNNVHWIEFNYHVPNTHSHILLEVTQKLQ
jgi:hypothetical protein